MSKISYEEGRRISERYGYEDYGEPLKEYRILSDDRLEETETSCSLMSVRRNGKCGWIDSNNRVIIPFEYDSLFVTCYDGIIILDKNGKQGGLYRTNLSRIAFQFKYDYLFHMYNMTYMAVKGDKNALVKPGDVMLTGYDYDGFLKNYGDRYTTFRKTTFWGPREGRIDLETGREL